MENIKLCMELKPFGVHGMPGSKLTNIPELLYLGGEMLKRGTTVQFLTDIK